ncbi:MAG: acetyltransferase [Deltaproteobacteria bacterium]|nr:acetyltransferase [Deltaproteobacteria bacterium]MCX7953059.1 acetyltransferase [Deltaproteobacteria bacterium]
MANVIVFGLRDIAELAWFYITRQSNDKVVAFTVHSSYKTCSEFCGLPVVEFENLEENFNAEEFLLFAPLSPRNMNRDREKVYLEGKKKGYRFYTFISPHATVLTSSIGENCFIFEDNTIQPFVEIGNNCIFWSGNHIGHHSKIEDHVFFSSHVVLSGHCHVCPYCYFGVNSTIRNHLTIAEGTCVAMAACITKNTEPWTIYIGVPAKPSGSSLEANI